MNSSYTSVAEDIRWLRETWWQHPELLSGADIRRGSATLRRLLVQDVLGQAWRQYGFDKQPTISGPDAEKIAELKGVRLEHAASLIVGGGRINGLDASMLGIFRVFNPKTGKGPDDEEGFAVLTTKILREAAKPQKPSELDPLVEYPWHLTAYLDAPGAVRRGELISRREVIDYFANYAGGVHLDRAKMTAKADKSETRKLIAELEQRISADTMDGLYFELLSMGQAVGRAQDMQLLEAAITGHATVAEGAASPTVGGLVAYIDRKTLG